MTTRPSHGNVLLNKVEATEREILSRLTKMASEKNVNLTYSHKLFFLRLLEYADAQDNDTPEGLTVYLSVKDLAKTLNVPFRTTIQCINRLTTCGAIRRYNELVGWGRSPSETVINKSIYEKREGSEE